MKNVLKILCAALLVAATVFTFASCATWDGLKEDIKGLLEKNQDEIKDAINGDTSTDVEGDTSTDVEGDISTDVEGDTSTDVEDDSSTEVETN